MTPVLAERYALEDPWVGTEINDWYNSLPTVPYTNGTVVVIDMINGFVHEGPLSGPRVAQLALPIRRFVMNAAGMDAPAFVSIQDTHCPDALEFNAYPPHAVENTNEAKLIPELEGLANWFVFKKDTLNPGVEARHGFNGMLQGWTEKRNPGRNADTRYTETFWLMGNCTDLCVYQTAMHMRQLFNVLHRENVRVIVVADLTDTYDAPWHPGDFYHRLFLKHMEQNGVEIVRNVEFGC